VAHDDALLDYTIWRPGAPDGVGDLHRADWVLGAELAIWGARTGYRRRQLSSPSAEGPSIVAVPAAILEPDPATDQLTLF
jgi:hypothetical protein